MKAALFLAFALGMLAQALYRGATTPWHQEQPQVNVRLYIPMPHSDEPMPALEWRT